MFIGRSFCGCLSLSSHKVLCWTGKKWEELVLTGGKGFNFRFMLLQQAGLWFIPAISFAVIFRKSAKYFKKIFHLLIYALLCQRMRKPAMFSKRVNKKGEGIQGVIRCGDLCMMQDSHQYPLNISFFLTAEFIILSKFVAVGENKDSATK